MRTTLTIDDDVAVALKRLRKSRDTSLKALVNEILRAGLKQVGARRRRTVPFRTRPLAVGRCLIGSIDNVAEALAVAEGEAFK